MTARFVLNRAFFRLLYFTTYPLELINHVLIEFFYWLINDCLVSFKPLQQTAKSGSQRPQKARHPLALLLLRLLYGSLFRPS